jgi:hypothetical protein
MTFFGFKLTDLESILFKNTKKTKSIFPDETQLIEFGLELMIRLTQITKDHIEDFWNEPNLVANYNLFARNRQLLLNAYICVLNSSYGTEFVILRTVLENNNLMRFFNKYPQHAFDWFSHEMQERFPEDIKSRYSISGRKNETFSFKPSTNNIFDVGKEKVKEGILDFYGQLCNYTHPNFLGWRELIGKQDETEFIFRAPQFSINNSENSIGITLYLMQLSFKTFVETFRNYLNGFVGELNYWQENYNKLIYRYID